ncbi:head decoration protein [Streptomyces sp. PTM05]|uniref:Head decoration protein n=1 Tax=Streptantibioticus parmotrematis TaxID=2873249 RepID=A0ABS7QNL0_9ACTN|nr:head decoration protein [Streptantibioticus parmotrematis]MBY8884765.1 head decoration protein [Streptantibioticus parmotrematis]
MSIQPVTTTEHLTANREWLASLHGTDSTDTITLDLNLFTDGVHYQCGDACDPYGRVFSGIPVGKVAESKLYGPYDPEAVCGRQVLRGFVFTEVPFAPGQTRIPAALLWHGAVKASKVPGGIDLSQLSWHPRGAQIRFV